MFPVETSYYCCVFQRYFVGTASRARSKKLGNSHENNLSRRIALQLRGEICVFDLAVNCPFKGQFHRYLSPMSPPYASSYCLDNIQSPKWGNAVVSSCSRRHLERSHLKICRVFCAQYSVRAHSQGMMSYCIALTPHLLLSSSAGI